MKWRAVVLAVLLAGVPGVWARPCTAHAAVGDAEVEQFDQRKFWDYAGCAMSIVFASTTQTWIVAGLACGRAMAAHWTD